MNLAHVAVIVLTTAMITALATMFAFTWWTGRKADRFRPVYEKTQSVVGNGEAVAFFLALERHLEGNGLRLFPGGLATQVANPLSTLSTSDFVDALGKLDGREFHYLIARAETLQPVAAVYEFRGEPPTLLVPSNAIAFIEALLKSIGIAYVMLSKEESRNPEQACQRIRSALGIADGQDDQPTQRSSRIPGSLA